MYCVPTNIRLAMSACPCHCKAHIDVLNAIQNVTVQYAEIIFSPLLKQLCSCHVGTLSTKDVTINISSRTYPLLIF
jgi:hypothetical protein